MLNRPTDVQLKWINGSRVVKVSWTIIPTGHLDHFVIEYGIGSGSYKYSPAIPADKRWYDLDVGQQEAGSVIYFWVYPYTHSGKTGSYSAAATITVPNESGEYALPCFPVMSVLCGGC